MSSLSDQALRADNHYVPRLCLKPFADGGGQVQIYRTLVSRPNVPLWKRVSVKGVAYLSHLYTRVSAGMDTDDVEKWFESEFETPAAIPLQNAVSDGRLHSDDWDHLIRLVAAQIVRTPAFFVKHLSRWKEDSGELLNSTLRDAIDEVQAAKKSGKPLSVTDSPHSDYLPIKVTAERDAGADTATVQAKLVIGRGVWFFAIKRLLEGAGRILHDQRWTILRPTDGLDWFTSDDPVTLLNYYGPDRYDFGGGWGKTGTEILMPISPRHLLYTKVGERPPVRGTIIGRAETQAIRRCIAEHAFRIIIANAPVEDIEVLRPRTVDEVAYKREHGQWLKWHADQNEAERELRGR